MKILISGATGFVGTNMINALSNKFEFVRLTRPNCPTTDPNTICLEDLAKHDPHGFDAIIHLAGKAHDLSGDADIEAYKLANTKFTTDLFDEFLTSPIRDFFYFSSVKAVADSVEGVLTEQVVPNPATAYGQSKQLAESYILSRSVPDGKRVFILRPCMIHGPGNKGNLNLLYKIVAKGIPYPLAAFENRRSFLSIDNLCYIIERLITDPNISGGIYNLSDDHPLSTNELIRILSKTAGFKARLWKVNAKLIKGLAKVGDKLKFPLNSERLKKLTESYVVSNGKIKGALKINNLPVSCEEGISRTIQSFHTH